RGIRLCLSGKTHTSLRLSRPNAGKAICPLSRNKKITASNKGGFKSGSGGYSATSPLTDVRGSRPRLAVFAFACPAKLIHRSGFLVLTRAKQFARSPGTKK
ncbi:hypothetical protein, partial [Candidatus Avelusimicrobium fimicolum]|uniref:hypothetical protein n=1 Tax=Candidatus Avelusimicrobium fimicolum TaxID=3416216 RepID=UPI003D0A65FA